MSTDTEQSHDVKYKTKTLFKFDRGRIPISDYFPNLEKDEVISVVLLLFASLDILMLNLTENDRIKSDILYEILLNFLGKSKILPPSLWLSANSIRQIEHLREYVRVLQGTIRAAMNSTHRRSVLSDGAVINKVLPSDFNNALISINPSSNISIDIPQQDIQLKVLLPVSIKSTLSTNEIYNICVFRYIYDFYEHGKLGKGGFGSVFCAKNRLDDRIYAIKKVVFHGNTDRIYRQAQLAQHEVRVLASLSHPNIVQYHSAWLELVPISTRVHRTSSSRSSSKRIKKSTSAIKPSDSVDEYIQFERELSVSTENKENESEKSPSQNSSTTSTDPDDNEDETSASESNDKQSDVSGQDRYHSSSDDSRSLSANEISHQISKCHYETFRKESKMNRELIPIQARNQAVSSLVQSNYSNCKIVLFIQMQLCDATLHEWLRYRDLSIIQKSSREPKVMFHSLSDLGQQQCWQIFTQLLDAVQYLHSQSFVHRDIKPRNIFLTYDSDDKSACHVKLGDFGLAALLDVETAAHSPHESQSDKSCGVGTALYASPEQRNSRHCIVTAKSDSYSLGIVLFELFNIFGTEMERSECIRHLREDMKVKDQFATYYPLEANIIEQLVLTDAEKRLSVEEIITIYSKQIQKKIPRQMSSAKQMIIDQLRKKLREQDNKIKQLELELNKKRPQLKNSESD